jgi:hypothetical protein
VSVVSQWEIQVKQLKAPDFLLDEPIENLLDRAAIDPIDLHFAVPHRLRICRLFMAIHSTACWLPNRSTTT